MAGHKVRVSNSPQSKYSYSQDQSFSNLNVVTSHWGSCYCTDSGSAGQVWGYSWHSQLAPGWCLWCYHKDHISSSNLYGCPIAWDLVSLRHKWDRKNHDVFTISFLCTYTGLWALLRSPYPCSEVLGTVLPLSYHCSEGKIFTAFWAKGILIIHCPHWF